MKELRLDSTNLTTEFCEVKNSFQFDRVRQPTEPSSSPVYNDPNDINTFVLQDLIGFTRSKIREYILFCKLISIVRH